MRLRQIALVAEKLEPAVSDLCSVLGVEVCFRDPGVAEFGLVNALMPIGDTFLEVVCPKQPDTTAGRLLARRGGDGGYMVILQTDDLRAARRRAAEQGVRIVWEIALPDVETVHLHPRDIGGAIVSLDEPRPPESWRWAGPDWQRHVRRDDRLAHRGRHARSARSGGDGGALGSRAGPAAAILRRARAARRRAALRPGGSARRGPARDRDRDAGPRARAARRARARARRLGGHRPALRDAGHPAPARHGMSRIYEALRQVESVARVRRLDPGSASRPFRVLTVANNKGGVGKSTLATNLAVYFRALREDLPVLCWRSTTSRSPTGCSPSTPSRRARRWRRRCAGAAWSRRSDSASTVSTTSRPAPRSTSSSGRSTIRST